MGQAQAGCCVSTTSDIDRSSLANEVGISKSGETVPMFKIPPTWSQAQAVKLQECIDVLFSKDNEELLGLDYSFTVADPHMPGCPLVGCSNGFTKLVGYEMREIVGQNCRFLVDPVPKDEIDVNARKHAREFCQAVKDGKDYFVPDHEREGWMPEGRPGDEILCFQRNARKDGSLFWNMFYMKVFYLGTEMDTLYPYIIALQSELPHAKATLSELSRNLGMLDQRMTDVTCILAKLFFTETMMCREQFKLEDDGFDGFEATFVGGADAAIRGAVQPIEAF
jgi:hypothetical protein